MTKIQEIKQEIEETNHKIKQLFVNPPYTNATHILVMVGQLEEVRELLFQELEEVEKNV